VGLRFGFVGGARGDTFLWSGCAWGRFTQCGMREIEVTEWSKISKLMQRMIAVNSGKRKRKKKKDV